MSHRLFTAISVTLFFSATLFSATAASAQLDTYTPIYYLGGTPGPGTPVSSGIIAQGHDGQLYASSGGGTLGKGEAYKFTTDGVLTDLHDFDGTHGENPDSGFTLGTDDYLYGTTSTGGAYGKGTIFRITPGGNLHTLYNFTGGNDGGGPTAPPVEALDGNFYGTTSSGGAVGNSGTIYRITPSGTFTLMHTVGGTTDIYNGINGALTLGSDGYLYGTTFYGGNFNEGTIFKLGTTGSFQILHNFHKPSGMNPQGPLVEGPDGTFYGTADHGPWLPVTYTGAVFKITSDNVYTVLANFGSGIPIGGLVFATDGNLYGTTFYGGIIFSITPAGDAADVYDFEQQTGFYPQGTLMQHTNGLLYGSTTLVFNLPYNYTPGSFYSFDIGAGPFVTFLPPARVVGNSIGILGQGFTGTTGVTFNGTPASFIVNSDTYLTATVPDGAATGFITVTTPSGMLTSNKKFQVRPTITSFSPTSGAAGATVTITGDSFTGTTKVKFSNNVKATSVTVNSDKKLTVVVPSGATTGAISVTTTGAASFSKTSFTVAQ
jgi:uncharacterized repeat protein (TIGR03803 family)